MTEIQTAPETQQHQFLWVDLETTGLVPAEGLILECAIVLCRDALGATFEEELAESVTLALPEGFEIETCDPVVQKMHTKNGLWDECRESTTTIEELDAALVELAKQLGAKPRSLVLAGFSVHFDQAWLKWHCPAFAAYLSHQVFDVSTIKRLVRTWAGEDPFVGEPAHRALADIRESIRAAKIFHDEFLLGAHGPHEGEA